MRRPGDLGHSKQADINEKDEHEEIVLPNARDGFRMHIMEPRQRAKTEEKIKQLTKATIRCIPFDAQEEHGTC